MNELSTTIERETGLSLFASSRFELALRQAEMLSKSDLLPKAFHGNPANCLIALELAERINTSPFLIAQNVDIIHGKPGFSAKFLIGCFNSSGRFDPITYEETPADGGSCRAISRDRSTGTPIEGPWVSMEIAKKEGWISKNGSKWQTMPQMMLRYRAASWMIRTTAPEISLGLPTTEEIADTGGAMGQEMRDATPRTPFARAKAEPAPDPETPAETVEAEVVATPHDRLKEWIGNAKLKVAEVVGALVTLGIMPEGKRLSDLSEATVEKILADRGTVLEVIGQLREGGEG